MLKKIILLLALIFFAANVEAAPQDNGMPFDPLATTASDTDSGALTLVVMKDTNELCFLVADNKARAMGMVPYTSRIYDFYLRKDSSGGYPPFIFMMVLPMEVRGQIDDNLGEWQENFHLLPVYALFNVKNGQVVCQKPFYSKSSLQSTHYHDTIKNPNHERMVEIFLTHMPRLHRLIRDQHISLP